MNAFHHVVQQRVDREGFRFGSAEPGEQTIYVSGQVETRSGQQSSYAAPEGIRLRVKAKTAAAGN